MNHGLTSFCAASAIKRKEVLLAEAETEADARLVLAPVKCIKATGSALSAMQKSQNFLLNQTRPGLDSFCAAIVIVKRDNLLVEAETEAEAVEEDFADNHKTARPPLIGGFAFCIEFIYNETIKVALINIFLNYERT